jgi:hypothetical protein
MRNLRKDNCCTSSREGRGGEDGGEGKEEGRKEDGGRRKAGRRTGEGGRGSVRESSVQVAKVFADVFQCVEKVADGFGMCMCVL